MTPLEARSLLGLIQSAWPSAPWPAATVALYRSRLEALDHQSTVYVVDRLVGTSKWLPAVGEIEVPVRARERAMRAESRGCPAVGRVADYDPTGWLELAKNVLAGRRQPPTGEQLDLF